MTAAITEPDAAETAPDCLVEQDGHVLIVTMNRPHRRNALSSEMLRIMESAWDRVNEDPEIRVCILTGAGGYFCAGMDLKTANEKPPSESFEDGSYDPTVIKGLLKGFRLTKPLIAAVEGPAIAGGTEILQGTDIRVAGESAKFGVAEARWSLYPMGGSAVRLPRDLGKHTARGQYLGGWQGGEKVVAYHEEEGFNPDSVTETFAAIRVDIDTRRWAGVPFYLRTGKRLGRRVTEIAVVFKKAPHLPFESSDTSELGKNAIVIRIQPDEGVTVRFGAKVPGTAMEVRDVTMDFGYGHAFTETSPEAYERLILDVLLGDPPLFPRHEEVELSWKILDPIEEFWASHGVPEQYRPGTWGPASADELLARDGRTWRRP